VERGVVIFSDFFYLNGMKINKTFPARRNHKLIFCVQLFNVGSEKSVTQKPNFHLRKAS